MDLLRAEKRGRRFEQAQTIPEAAAAASGSYIGKRDLQALIGTLQSPATSTDSSAEMLKAKMQLLMHGEQLSMLVAGCAVYILLNIPYWCVHLLVTHVPTPLYVPCLCMEYVLWLMLHGTSNRVYKQQADHACP